MLIFGRNREVTTTKMARFFVQLFGDRVKKLLTYSAYIKLIGNKPIC